jgi:pimeloyl-ACP methyl ester carboxylesterase
MNNLRTYGKPPYRLAVIHGGPGAPGYMAPVARELAKDRGVLEPLQTKDTIDGQIEELVDVLRKNADIPVVLIGHSWGAGLSLITTARFPALVKKLVLIGSSPVFSLELPDVTPVWLERLSEAERRELFTLVDDIHSESGEDRNASLGKLIRLIFPAHTYDPIPVKDEVLAYQYDINRDIGLEIRKLVAGGTLAGECKTITCPVVAIHGDYDPQPAGLVREQFQQTLRDFKFILLKKCGHTPWVERFAHDEFFRVLRKEII